MRISPNKLRILEILIYFTRRIDLYMFIRFLYIHGAATRVGNIIDKSTYVYKYIDSYILYMANAFAQKLFTLTCWIIKYMKFYNARVRGECQIVLLSLAAAAYKTHTFKILCTQHFFFVYSTNIIYFIYLQLYLAIGNL